MTYLPQPMLGMLSLTAQMTVGGQRAVMFAGLGGARVADPASPGFQFAGISLHAAETGDVLQVMTSGSLVEPTWTWTPTKAVYVAPDGTLTQTVPVTGLVQQIGIAITETSILVQSRTPIMLV